MTAPVGAAPSMLRPGQRALTFPRATLKARIAHGPLGYPLSSSLSSVLSSSSSVPVPGRFSRQTPRRSSQGVRKHLSEPAPISLFFTDVRLSPPVSGGRLWRLRRPLLSRSFSTSAPPPLLFSLLLATPFGSLAPPASAHPAKPAGLPRPPRWLPPRALTAPRAPQQEWDVPASCVP